MTLALIVLLQIADGDRVVLLGNGFLERDVEWGHLEGALVRGLAGKRVSFRNLGWSGDAVDAQLRPNGFPPLEKWLEELQPTVLLVAFGMNESFAGPKGVDPFRKGLEAQLDRLASTKARIVLLSPIRHENLGPPLPDPVEHNRDLSLYTAAIKEISDRRKLTFVDLFSLVGAPGRAITENGIHLNPEGYALAGRVLAQALTPPALSWRVEIDASGKPGLTTGVTIGKSEPGPRFTATDDALPDRRTLVVTGFPAGRFSLKVDGAKVATAGAEEWSRGVTFSDDREKALRQAIVRKNQLYFIRWRPQNMEYIYGTRSRAQGANVGNPQFASEFRQLEKQVDEEEKAIQKRATPTPSVYEVVRE